MIIALTGRTVVEPFSFALTATALTALFEGLIIRRAVDPDVVDDEMFGDIAASLADRDHPVLEVGARCSATPRSRSSTTTSCHRRPVPACDGDAPPEVGSSRPPWTCSATDGKRVSASDVAERSGVSTQTILNLFGSVRGVAAATFAGHAAEIRRNALRHANANADPVAALRLTLVDLAERASSDPEAARALLSERLEVALHRGGSLADMDIRLEVPLANAVMMPLSQMELGDNEPLELATTLINFVLCVSVGRTMSSKDTAEMALRLVPLTALVAPLHPDQQP